MNFDIYVSANVQPYTVGTGAGAFDVYPVYGFRKGAYGTTSLKNLELIYKPYGSGGTEDPLDQRASIGWKAYFGCAILNPFFLVRMETRSTVNYGWQKEIE